MAEMRSAVPDQKSMANLMMSDSAFIKHTQLYSHIQTKVATGLEHAGEMSTALKTLCENLSDTITQALDTFDRQAAEFFDLSPVRKCSPLYAPFFFLSELIFSLGFSRH